LEHPKLIKELKKDRGCYEYIHSINAQCRTCLLLCHEYIPEVGVDCWELTDGVDVEIERPVGSHYLELQDLIESTNAPREELDDRMNKDPFNLILYKF
jgi:hypothetical protein